MSGDSFNVTTTVQSLPLTEGEQQIGFTVSNLLDRSVRAHSSVEVLKDNQAIETIDWIEVVRPDTFDMAPDGSATVDVRIRVPAVLPDRWAEDKVSLQLRLVVRNVDAPEKEKGESVLITLHPERPVEATRPRDSNLWRILTLVAGGLAVIAIAGVVVLATRDGNQGEKGEKGDKGDPPTATEIVAAVKNAAQLSLACEPGWRPAGHGRLCIEDHLSGPGTAWAAIADCSSKQARVCTHNDMQQACGSGFDPYRGVTEGWYGDHGMAASGDFDDEYLTWNFGRCGENNDGPPRHATLSSLQYRCCY